MSEQISQTGRVTPPNDPPTLVWRRRHLIGLEELSAEEILHIFQTAESFKEVSTRSIKKVPALRGKRCRESSEVRLARLEELLSKQQKFSEEDLIKIFSDHGADDKGSDNTVCRHSDYFCTTLSVILYPASKKFKVLYGHPCEYEYAQFSF